MAAAAPGLTGAEAMAAAQIPSSALPAGYYPPGFESPNTGQPDAVIDRTFKIDGPPITDPSQIHSTDGGPGINKAGHDTGERYDCVIVGAGASGISAAKSYLDRFGPDKKILILDALPDFGGHSHRNEFHIPNAADGDRDVMTLRNGGTVNLDSIGTWNKNGPSGIPGSYGQPAIDFLAWAGVDTATATKWQNGGAAGIPASFGLYQRLLFPAAEFGARPRDRRAQRRPVRRAGADHGRRLERVPRAHALLRRGARRASCACSPRTRTSSPTRRARR